MPYIVAQIVGFVCNVYAVLSILLSPVEMSIRATFSFSNDSLIIIIGARRIIYHKICSTPRAESNIHGARSWCGQGLRVSSQQWSASRTLCFACARFYQFPSKSQKISVTHSLMETYKALRTIWPFRWVSNANHSCGGTIIEFHSWCASVLLNFT